MVVAELNDSAYQLVKSLDEKTITNPEDRAHYNLLMTQTSILAGSPLPSDSLLDVAIGYYQQTDNKEKLADAYYYKNVGAYNAKDDKLSMLYLKKAEEMAEKGGTLRQHYKIAEGISFVNVVNGKSDLALNYAKQALLFAKRINNKRWLANAYYQVGVSFSEMEMPDSAICYIGKTESLIQYLNEKEKPYFLSNLAFVYKDIDPNKAKEYIQEALSYKKTTRMFEYLAEITYFEGNEEEAYNLLKRALTVNDLTPKDNIIHNLLEYDIEHGRTDKVCEQVNEIIAIKDSIINKVKNDTIKDLQTRYDHQVAMNAANTRLIHWQWGLGGLAFAIACLIGYIVWRKRQVERETIRQERKIASLCNQVSRQEVAMKDAQIEIADLKAADSQRQQKIKSLEAIRNDAEHQIAGLRQAKSMDSQKIETLEKAKKDAEKKIEELNGSVSRNNQKIAELEQTRDRAIQEIETMDEKMKMWAGAEVKRINNGMELYKKIENNENVLTWQPQDYSDFINYYEATHYDAVKKIRKKYGNITQRSMLCLILEDMGKTKEEISHILNIKKKSIRSLKYRIKASNR